MTISRRDTILMTVLINLGVVGILLVTAITDQDEDLVQASTTPLSQEMSPIAAAQNDEKSAINPVNTKPFDSSSRPVNLKPLDEVDKVIAAYAADKPVKEVVDNSQPVTNSNSLMTNSNSVIANSNAPKSPYVSVTVKRGDTLEKIARANATTIEDIKRINKLSTDRLKVGQVLQMPISAKPLVAEVVTPAEDGGVYATVEKGDNPWKIARRFNVSYTQILRLNDLDEASARNLKVGDKIRVK